MQINRIAIVQVAGQGVINQYGDMIFKANDGNEYKLSKKRPEYFGLIIPGKTVKLGYSTYNNQEYIAEVTAAEPQQTPSTKTVAQKQPISSPGKYQTTSVPVSGAEKGMIIKEIGDNFRTGVFQIKDYPELWAFYKSEIARVTGVKVG